MREKKGGCGSEEERGRVKCGRERKGRAGEWLSEGVKA